jgi:hypothetical protein
MPGFYGCDSHHLHAVIQIDCINGKTHKTTVDGAAIFQQQAFAGRQTFAEHQAFEPGEKGIRHGDSAGKNSIRTADGKGFH